MKKIITSLGLVSALTLTCMGVAGAEKVVVVPLGDSPAAFESVTHHYSIPGKTFTPVRSYSQTEADGYIVTHLRPGIILIGSGTEGVTHRKDAGKLTFTAPVHLPDGAAIGHVGAAVCSGNEALADHNIIVSLRTQHKVTGTHSVVRSHTITSTNCDTLQAGSGVVLFQTVDNTYYTYELYVTGLEGGTCAPGGFPGSYVCDERKTYLEFGDVAYTTSDIIEP